MFGRRAGRAVVEQLAGGDGGDGPVSEAAARAALRAVEDRVDRLAHAAARDDAYDIRAEMIDTMKTDFGIFREERRMSRASTSSCACEDRMAGVGLRHAGAVFNLDMIRTLELEGMLDVAIATALGAVVRTESRGSHARTDYPNRDDAHWLQHTLAHYQPDGPPDSPASP